MTERMKIQVKLQGFREKNTEFGATARHHRHMSLDKLLPVSKAEFSLSRCGWNSSASLPLLPDSKTTGQGEPVVFVFGRAAQLLTEVPVKTLLKTFS